MQEPNSPSSPSHASSKRGRKEEVREKNHKEARSVTQPSPSHSSSSSSSQTTAAQEAAKKEQADAQYNMGLAFQRGNEDIPPSPVPARECFKEAAEKGHAEAQFKLGLAYLHSDESLAIRHPNPSEAMKYFRQAYAQSHPDAAFWLGDCHEKGLGNFPRNLHSAKKLYEEAFKWGRASAVDDARRVTSLLAQEEPLDASNSYVTPAKNSKAEIEPATPSPAPQSGAQGETPRPRTFKEIFSDVIRSSKLDASQNSRKAEVIETATKELLERENWKGDTDATLVNIGKLGSYLAEFYKKGDIVEKSPSNAAKLYQKLVDLQHPHAEYTLGLAYLRSNESLGISRDEFRALDLLGRSAKKNYPPAIAELGQCHEEGLRGLLSQDLFKAREQYQKAASLGHKPSEEHVKRIENLLSTSESSSSSTSFSSSGPATGVAYASQSSLPEGKASTQGREEEEDGEEQSNGSEEERSNKRKNKKKAKAAKSKKGGANVTGEQSSSSSSSMPVDPIAGIAPLTFEQAVIQGDKQAVCKYLAEQPLKRSSVTKKKHKKPAYEHITELCNHTFEEEVLEEKEAKKNVHGASFNIFQVLAYKAMKCSSVEKLRDYHDILSETINALFKAIEKRKSKSEKEQLKYDKLSKILTLQTPTPVNGKKYTVLSAMFHSLKPKYHPSALNEIFKRIQDAYSEREMKNLLSNVLRELFSDDRDLNTKGQRWALVFAKTMLGISFVQSKFAKQEQEILPLLVTLAEDNCHKTITTVLTFFKDPKVIRDVIISAVRLDLRSETIEFTNSALIAMEYGHKETTNVLLNFLPLKDAEIAIEVFKERHAKSSSKDFLRYANNYFKERRQKENPTERIEQGPLDDLLAAKNEREQKKEREMPAPAPKVESKNSKAEITSEASSTVISNSFNDDATREEIYTLAESYKDTDVNRAAELYLIAATLGDSNAQYSLGEFYSCPPLNLVIIKENEDKAVEWFQKAAKQGHALAQGNLGARYENNQDYSQALVWYRKAAAQNNDWAQYKLGSYYEDGRGVTSNISTAIVWYRKAAAQNNSLAQYKLGRCYEDGRGVIPDIDTAIEWYIKAALHGDALAQQALKRLKVTREVPDSNLDSEIKSSGILSASSNLVSEEKSSSPSKQDSKERETSYQNLQQKFEELNNTWRRSNSGREELLDIMTQLANHPEVTPSEQWHLAVTYSRLDPTKHKQEQRKLINLSAERGLDMAQIRLARDYELGRDVEKSTHTAIKWYREVAKQWNPYAIESLERLEKELGLNTTSASTHQATKILYSWIIDSGKTVIGAVNLAEIDEPNISEAAFTSEKMDSKKEEELESSMADDPKTLSEIVKGIGSKDATAIEHATNELLHRDNWPNVTPKALIAALRMLHTHYAQHERETRLDRSKEKFDLMQKMADLGDAGAKKALAELNKTSAPSSQKRKRENKEEESQPGDAKKHTVAKSVVQQYPSQNSTLSSSSSSSNSVVSNNWATSFPPPKPPANSSNQGAAARQPANLNNGLAGSSSNHSPQNTNTF